MSLGLSLRGRTRRVIAKNTVYTNCRNCTRKLTNGKGNITCKVCFKYVHLLCSGFNDNDLDRDSQDYKANQFVCKPCTEKARKQAIAYQSGDLLGSESAGQMDWATQTEELVKKDSKDVLILILKELRDTKQENFKLHEKVNELVETVKAIKAEKNEFRRCFKDFNGSRSRSRNRNKGMTTPHDREMSRSRSRSVNRQRSSVKFVNTNSSKPVNRSKFVNNNGHPSNFKSPKNKAFNKRDQHFKPQRVMRVNGQADLKNVENTGETSTGGTPNLDRPPVPVVRISYEPVFISGLESDVKAKDLFQYINSQGVKIKNIRKISTKHEGYSSFVVEASELSSGKLFNETLWNPGTLVKDHNKERESSIVVLESFPIKLKPTSAK